MQLEIVIFCLCGVSYEFFVSILVVKYESFELYVFISTLDGPPTPSRLNILNITDTSVTVAWSDDACDGGHQRQYVILRIQEQDLNDDYYYYYYFFRPQYRYIESIDAHLMNYTITGLAPSTSYDFSVRAEGRDRTFSGFSPEVTVTTLPPGQNVEWLNCNLLLKTL